MIRIREWICRQFGHFRPHASQMDQHGFVCRMCRRPVEN
jgi:hypothetical protein